MKEETQVFKNIVLALERIEKRQRLLLSRLDGMAQEQTGGEGRGCGRNAAGDAWLEKGIDNILAYQVGKKRGEQA